MTSLPSSVHAASEPEVVRPAEWVGGFQRREGNACAELDTEVQRAKQVSRFVGDLMAWRAHMNFVDKLTRAKARPTTQPSALSRLEHTVALGIVGSGNSGSKGVWCGEGPVDALIDASEARTTLALISGRDKRWWARFDAMPEDLAVLVAWIRDETQGECPKAQRADDPPGYVIEYPAEGKRLARRITGLSLAEIVGLSTADEAQRARWEGKMRSGDSAPARAGMKERGEALLDECARAWFGGGT